jgi:hypothetical protein
MDSIPKLYLENEKLTAITLDTNVVIFFGEKREFKLRILEEDFIVSLGKLGKPMIVHFSAWSTPPKNVTGVSSLPPLINQRVTSAGISDTGELTIHFDDESSLSVRPGGTDEAYTFVGAGQIIVCNGDGTIS